MKTQWYKNAVVYQVYPRSFMDGDGDGMGDLAGIKSRLDYFKQLGVDAVWFSPLYESPDVDNGYDISDYYRINPHFGTMEEMQEVIDGLHERGIKVIMDLVVNHTSDMHKWFAESRNGNPDSPYRDYYIWKKGRGINGKRPPNNWKSRFTGPAWTYDQTRKEWYLHLFSANQPDLNWDNPKVRKEVADICNFWLKKGVDGFRCDVITYISKNSGLPNGKGDKQFVLGEHYHEYIKELAASSWNKYDTYTVAEAIGVKIKDAESVIAERNKEFDSMFAFDYIRSNCACWSYPNKFDFVKFKKMYSAWQQLPSSCQNAPYLENHDRMRSVSHFTDFDDATHPYAAKMLATMLLTSKGTPFIYQGEEIGMTNCDFKPHEYNDVETKQRLKKAKGLPSLRKKITMRSRDNARTPMQWDSKDGAGFTTNAFPWLKVNPNYTKINVASQLQDKNSVLNFYRELIAMRKNSPALLQGDFTEYCKADKSVYIYTRKCDAETLLVVCNFKKTDINFKLPDELKDASGKTVICNYETSAKDLHSTIGLRPFEARIYRLESETKLLN